MKWLLICSFLLVATVCVGVQGRSLSLDDDEPQPPPYEHYAEMARYVVHRSSEY